MKPLKNKKRFDPRHFLTEKRENTTTKSNSSGVEWNLNEFVVDDPTPEGKPLKKNTKKDLGLPDEVTDKKGKSRERAIADTSMTEGGCGSEMPPQAVVQGPMNLTPDEAYDTGYADAVEEIMNSISHLLPEPVGEPVAIEIEEEKKPDFPDIDGDGDREEPISKAAKDKEAMNEQPSIEDLMRKSAEDSPYAGMPVVHAKLVRKGPVRETVPMIDSASAKNPEALKDIIRNWLRIGYGVDEVELTSDGQVMDVAEFLDIDPMEEQ